ncbi:hypothetical protein D3C80_1338560 [compost metagenome]
MAGEGMAKHVRVQVLAQLALAGRLHAHLDGPRAQAIALAGNEHGAVARAADAAQAQPGLQRLACLAPDRQHACLAALAKHLHQPGGEVEVFEVQAGQLGQAQA